MLVALTLVAFGDEVVVDVAIVASNVVDNFIVVVVGSS